MADNRFSTLALYYDTAACSLCPVASRAFLRNYTQFNTKILHTDSHSKFLFCLREGHVMEKYLKASALKVAVMPTGLFLRKSPTNIWKSCSTLSPTGFLLVYSTLSPTLSINQLCTPFPVASVLPATHESSSTITYNNPPMSLLPQDAAPDSMCPPPQVMLTKTVFHLPPSHPNTHW